MPDEAEPPPTAVAHPALPPNRCGPLASLPAARVTPSTQTERQHRGQRERTDHGRVLQVPVAAQQVDAAPVLAIGDELDRPAEDRLTQHYRAPIPLTPVVALRAQPARIPPGGAAADEAGPQPGSGAAGRSAVRMRRSRGAVSAVLLVGLGGWGALVPFLGPFFGYAFGSYHPWAFSPDRWWLDIVPGLAVVLGG